MNIKVVNKRDGTGNLYIGRGSPLGNPFVMKDNTNTSRNKVIDDYEKYINVIIRKAKPDLSRLERSIIKELNNIYARVKKGQEVRLECYCAPQRCHGDVIKNIIVRKLQETK